jgi:hypothetical protein
LTSNTPRFISPPPHSGKIPVIPVGFQCFQRNQIGRDMSHNFIPHTEIWFHSRIVTGIVHRMTGMESSDITFSHNHGENLKEIG